MSSLLRNSTLETVFRPFPKILKIELRLLRTETQSTRLQSTRLANCEPSNPVGQTGSPGQCPRNFLFFAIQKKRQKRSGAQGGCSRDPGAQKLDVCSFYATAKVQNGLLRALKCTLGVLWFRGSVIACCLEGFLRSASLNPPAWYACQPALVSNALRFPPRGQTMTRLEHVSNGIFM